MKLICSVNSKKHLNSLIKKKIDGVILYIDKLSVNSANYFDISILDEVEFGDKEVFICLNKIMHNNDLAYLREIMNKLKDRNVKILFYDMAVYNIAREYDMVDKLVIYQDHLNVSTLSNNFYYKLGIKTSFIASDITGEEVLEIKKNSKIKVMFLGYGYAPIFYSRRYLIRNYLTYINDNNNYQKYEILSDTGNKYPIREEEYGTTIYTEHPINLINHLNELEDIDYLVMQSNMIPDGEFNKMVDKFIKRGKVKGEYIGFFNTKTIYKVK